MNEVLVLMEGIEKTFPGVHALSQCQFELRAGEVHALVGDNGAGKSTLMKILTGVYQKDEGRILFKGNKAEISSPRAAQDLGISIIHQELNLMPHLTVAQNIFIGREPRQKVHFVLDEKEINQNICFTIKVDNSGSTTVSPLDEQQYLLHWQSWKDHYYCERPALSKVPNRNVLSIAGK